ncbi:phage tail assembly chaperone [Vibrio fluvialis]|uniref:phage tail assembly chaperone n=1 Tax=Vibrio fluvialis TaxID=676 RepID=UPI001BAE91F3|nr:hypothetical protein [Vibrio fluvialis]QUF70051.1 hypothetical protein KC397_06565 [Vibrio fluvialis]
MNHAFARIAQTTLKSGKKVQIYKLPASKGITIGMKLGKTFLPSIGQFLDGSSTGAGIHYESLALSLVQELDNFEILPIISELLKEMAIDGQEVNLDDYFMANYGELLEILVFALKENFSSFFAASGLLEQFLPNSKQEATVQES